MEVQFSYYKNHILEIIQIYNGGLAIHGGIIAGFITLKLFTKKHNLYFLKVTCVHKCYFWVSLIMFIMFMNSVSVGLLKYVK